MIYAQYYILTSTPGEPSDTLTYRKVNEPKAIVSLNSLQSKSMWHRGAIAANGDNRPYYDAYRLFKGDPAGDSKPVSKLFTFLN